MQITRYNPLRDLDRMKKELDNFWYKGWGSTFSNSEATFLDLYEEDGKLTAEVSLPNFKKEEIKVSIDKGVLEVSAEHTEKEEDKLKRRYYFRESTNQYLRRISLPEGIEDGVTEAEFKNGVLKITMPAVKVPKNEEKLIPIK